MVLHIPSTEYSVHTIGVYTLVFPAFSCCGSTSIEDGDFRQMQEKPLERRKQDFVCCTTQWNTCCTATLSGAQVVE